MLWLSWLLAASAGLAVRAGETSTDASRAAGGRQGKALAFVSDVFLDRAGAELEAAQSFGSDLALYDDVLQDPLPPQDVYSRSRPSDGNSPIYYIRLPPEPYVFVPGLGYVSRPPRPVPPPVVQPGPESETIHLPTKFVSNAKPTGVYTLAEPGARPSPVHHLDKGPYTFNGKPADLYMLRSLYNTLYDDTLHNFYP